MAGKGCEGFEVMQRTEWGYATHPNIGGALLVGLGCEVMQIPGLMEDYGLKENENFRTMTIQATGGTRKTIDRGVEMIKEMLPRVAAVKRETVPVSEIMLALQCGGSDGYSGITANPALGKAADLLVEQGGTAVLCETPEIYGAEHLLTRRAATREIGEKLIDIIKWWEDYTARNRGEMNNNPSPGNKAGGLTTILEKSLGAAAKGGTTTLRGVYHYAEPIKTRGFVFMDSPGYDPVGVTGQVASGCNIICFTTGRGSAFGFKPAPSIKLATNNDTFFRQEEDMDINCGDILDGVTIEDEGQADPRRGDRRRLRQEVEVGGVRLRRQRVRALADRRGDVARSTAGTGAAAPCRAACPGPRLCSRSRLVGVLLDRQPAAEAGSAAAGEESRWQQCS